MNNKKGPQPTSQKPPVRNVHTCQAEGCNNKPAFYRFYAEKRLCNGCASRERMIYMAKMIYGLPVLAGLVIGIAWMVLK